MWNWPAPSWLTDALTLFRGARLQAIAYQPVTIGCMKNIFEALRVSHETQRALCAQMLATSPDGPDRRRLFTDLKRELAAHATAEERCLYVPLFEHDSTVDASRHAIAEHHEMDELVEDLQAKETNDSSWLAIARKLSEKVHHHLQEEETKFFQLAGKVLTEKQKSDLAKDYEAEFLTQRTKD